MTMARIRALLGKEFLDLARNRTALLPVVLVTILTLVTAFGIAIVLPIMTGHALGEDTELLKLSTLMGVQDELSGDGRIQLFLFQQFLLLFLAIPITGAMALAAHAIVGEKQARTLEPLLATPITTFELLIAKVLGALLPTLGVSLTGLAVYFLGVALFGEPGVLGAMASTRTAALLLIVGPASALVSLQSAIVISSRVNDARTAQQFGVMIIIPLSVLLVAQFMGTVWLSATSLALIGLGLFGVWMLLTVFSVAIFERESILTRWR
jgi:ABC-2 type transport system permease protein